MAKKRKKNSENIEEMKIREADINKITEYGILMTPGFVVDGEVKSVGKVLSAGEIKTIIQG